jgi:hypothetical protein
MSAFYRESFQWRLKELKYNRYRILKHHDWLNLKEFWIFVARWIVISWIRRHKPTRDSWELFKPILKDILCNVTLLEDLALCLFISVRALHNLSQSKSLSFSADLQIKYGVHFLDSMTLFLRIQGLFLRSFFSSSFDMKC